MVDVTTLIARCRRGDALAWEALVRKYQGRVLGLARHYMRDPEEARDVAQDIFIRVYERLDSFQGGERFVPWMLSLARNCCIDRLRRIKVRTPERAVPVEEDPQIPAEGPSVEQQAATGERAEMLYAALDEMSETNREMILLKEIQGLKLEEIATMLSVPVGTVKSRSNRARSELARRIRILDPSYGSAV
ncbi:MAG: sigma-70 family RNA polymerase sigma factor [Acidobacteria bacterium]|nr:sigma-70 family RNA polymerase sigma factor [Acidobacteriota bacterium]NIM61881.1 sigma-70 family RNA polymerase sigma factor [Acidobacteriota bacterium]NIO60838.1 sigma-70 family RNA polymerase sigma factor [Acidobacteriota bacterium]NIQ31913.1 sigma-70 family RNA polymerase sigma factor [Acidobacteriota bacterium]NIQ87290.1 sigma-70 family RNA polymerase sigma factor [Acidobacteriota bacterium]